MRSHLALLLLSTVIGVLIGSVGMGGFFLPPTLLAFTEVTVHQSMATSLFTFIFTGIAGSVYFYMKGSIDWPLVRPVCLGAAVTGFAGAWVGARLNPSVLTLALAVLIIIAGLYTLTQKADKPMLVLGKKTNRQWLVLTGIGALTGFLSGLTGIGGPALSVPLMVFFGFSLIPSIAAGQVLQIVGALSGTIANFQLGTIDYTLAALVSTSEIVGVLSGAYLVHRLDVELIRRLMGGLCLVAGCTFIVRAL